MEGRDINNFVITKLIGDLFIGPIKIGFNSGISKKENQTKVATRSNEINTSRIFM